MKSSANDTERRGRDRLSLRRSIISREHLPRFVALAFWAAILVGYYYYTSTNDIGALDVVRALIDLMQGTFYGPLLYILFYTLQPLIFFPSWLLSVAGGFLYGPLWGTFYTLIAANTSALVAYGVGRFFGRGLLESSRSQNLLRRYAIQLREYSFGTILVMRFLFLPYDIVSYVAGFLRIHLRPFILATLLGSLPGTLAFVTFGAAIEGDFQGRQMGVNPWVMGFSIGMMVVSLLLWRLFSRSRRQSGS